MMKESQEAKRVFVTWFTLFMISLACVACLIQVQWTLYTHQIQIDNLLKENEEMKDLKQQLFQQNKQDAHYRVKRSNHLQRSPRLAVNLSSEISQQIQEYLRSKGCVNTQLICFRGPRGERGPEGPPGPPCPQCSIPSIDKGPLRKYVPSTSPQPSRRIITGSNSGPGMSGSSSSILVIPKSASVNQDGLITFYCLARGFPNSRISWQKVGGILPFGRHTVFANGGLLLKSVQKSDKGTYKCTATSINGITKVGYVRLNVEDKTQILKKPSSIVTEEGSDVTFNCEASGDPTPNITWSGCLSSLPADRYQVSLTTTQEKQVGLSPRKRLSSSLTLKNVSVKNSGTFICEATSRLNTEKATGLLIVLPSLSFSVVPPANIEVEEGQDAWMHCSAVNAVGLSWIQPQGIINSIIHENGTLGLRKITIKNQGTYTCTARNAYREITAETHLKVKKRRYLISTILRLPGNEKYLKALSGFLAPVLRDPSTSRWVRCWHAASDGWDITKTFHPQCDGKGPTVTIVRVGKHVFGGYAETSWYSSSQYFSSTKSFLFSLYNVKGFYPVKLPLTGNYNQYASYWGKSYGPTFGNGHDIYISNHASSKTSCYTTPHTYSPPPGCSFNAKCSFFVGTSSFTPSDVEVFYEMS